MQMARILLNLRFREIESFALRFGQVHESTVGCPPGW